MNHPVFSLLSKANVTKSKYCWFLLPEAELISMEVFTSRSISDILSSSQPMLSISFPFTIFFCWKGITRRRQTGYQVRYLPENIFKELVTILSAQNEGFAQRLKRCLYETFFVLIAPVNAVRVAKQ